MCLPAALKIQEKSGSYIYWIPTSCRSEVCGSMSGSGQAHRMRGRSCAPCCPQPTKAHHTPGSSPGWAGWCLPGYQKATMLGKDFSVLLLLECKTSTDVTSLPELCIPVEWNRFACYQVLWQLECQGVWNKGFIVYPKGHENFLLWPTITCFCNQPASQGLYAHTHFTAGQLFPYFSPTVFTPCPPCPLPFCICPCACASPHTTQTLLSAPWPGCLPGCWAIS